MGSAIDPRPLKIAVLTTSFPLAPESMSGIFVQRLVSHLPHDLRITVLTPAPTGHVPPTAAKPGFSLECFRYAPAAWQTLAQGPGGIQAALSGNRWLLLLLPVFFASMFVACLRLAGTSDLLHANWSINGVVAGIAGLLTRTPVITTLRGSDVNLSPSSKTMRFMLRCCLRLSHKVVVVSKAINHYVAAQFPEYADKLIFIPNGVDDAFLSIKPGRLNGKIRLFYGGSLTSGKGVDTIILALKQLSHIDDIELAIVGDGPERFALVDLTETAGVASYVRFHGRVRPELMPGYLEQSDIVLLASHSEGRPNIVLEAMAAGLPVIATDIEGVKELVEEGKTGMLFRPGDVDQLAAAINFLVRTPDTREKMGTAARHFIISNKLTWQESGQRYAELYRNTVAPQVMNQ